MDDEHSEEASSERNEQPSQYSKQSFHTLNRHRRSHDWRNQALTLKFRLLSISYNLKLFGT
jgi:hypothetical protein